MTSSDAAKGDLISREAAVRVAERWADMNHAQLHAGEMSAQERRSVKAVVGAITSALRSLPAAEQPAVEDADVDAVIDVLLQNKLHLCANMVRRLSADLAWARTLLDGFVNDDPSLVVAAARSFLTHEAPNV